MGQIFREVGIQHVRPVLNPSKNLGPGSSLQKSQAFEIPAGKRVLLPGEPAAQEQALEPCRQIGRLGLRVCSRTVAALPQRRSYLVREAFLEHF